MYPTNRRYTLTHNDITGELWLSIGNQYNSKQISGFYTRLLRDEVKAEWKQVGQSLTELHVFCHVSGEERWLAPPALRNYIFRREMALVLDCVVYADRDLIDSLPSLAEAQVVVHFQSSVKELDKIESWGMLGDRGSWKKTESIMKRILFGLAGRSDELTSHRESSQEDLPHEHHIRPDHEQISASTSSETSTSNTKDVPSQQRDLGDCSIEMENGLNGIALDDLFPNTRPLLMSSRPPRKR